MTAFLKAIVTFILFTFSFGQVALADRKAEDFVLTQSKAFGDWELFCGHFGDPTEESCNLRFTSIYSKRPDFRAAILFLEPEGKDIVLNMSYEAFSIHLLGGLTNADGLNISMAPCIYGKCQLRDEDLKAFLESLVSGKDITSSFMDYGYQSKDVIIPASRFAEGYGLFVKEMERLGKDSPSVTP